MSQSEFTHFNRRQFLKYGALAAGTGLISAGGHTKLAQQAIAQNFGRPKKMVVVLLRGALDGLNTVVPYRDSNYYIARPTIAIPGPGKNGGVINLDNEFGLHPALSDLMPFWRSRQLAFVHASGSPDPTRSHFDAQDYVETGTPGRRGTSSGWMNRMLEFLPQRSSTVAVNIGSTTPRILSGPIVTSNVNANRRGVLQKLAIDQEPVQGIFDQLYQGNDLLANAYQEGRRSRKVLRQGLNRELVESANGAPAPDYLPQNFNNIVKLLTGPSQTDVLFMSLGGWDTHINQGDGQGQLANRLKPLGRGLALLSDALGPTFDDTVIVVMSEFGRTVRENGNRGTDHGHGNVMMVLGGPVAGGQIYGDWLGLERENLHTGRDLPVTTDFRDVLGPLLARHYQLNSGAIAQIFPGFQSQNPIQVI